MNIGVISDIFNYLGGAELNDDVLISFLEKKHNISRIKSAACSVQDIKQQDFLIVTNFCLLDASIRDYISKNSNYILFFACF